MLSRRVALSLTAILMGLSFQPCGAEISAPGAGTGPAGATPESAYQSYIGNIHKATKAAQLPKFAHSSPLNMMKLSDTRYEEKEMLEAFQEMTPHSLKAEGKIEFDGRTYLFFEGDPSESVKKKEYFPILVEMVKEEGTWRLRRQQSWHVKDGSKEAQIVQKGAARIKRYQDLFAAISQPAGATRIVGTLDGKPFKPTNCYLIAREHYFKLCFIDGHRGFALYVRDDRSMLELQNQTIIISPLDGQKCDSGNAILGPWAGKIQFGKLQRGALYGTISMLVCTPFVAGMNGAFFAEETEADSLSPESK